MTVTPLQEANRRKLIAAFEAPDIADQDGRVNL